MRRVAILCLLLAGCGGSADPMPPVAWLDEHYEALGVWRVAAKSGKLPAGATLVHLDAHPDMGVPEPEETELTVSNFVVPAIREGILSRVTWVIPPWLEEDEHTLAYAEGLVQRSTGEGSFYAMTLDSLPGLPGVVALDIDLDFFACENPHEGHVDRPVSRAEYEDLRASRRIRMEGTSEEDGVRTESAVLARKGSRFEWPVRIDRVTDLRSGDVTWVRGCVCMGEYAGEFPVHRPKEKQWRSLVHRVGRTLEESGIRPVLITVSRSSSSGFVPKDVVGPLEEAVDAMLREVYGSE